jgi:urease accessory protein UreH
MKQLSRKIQQRSAGGCYHHHLPGRTRTWNPPLEPTAPDIGGFASFVSLRSYTRRRRTLTAAAATTTTTDVFLVTTTTPHFNKQGSSANDSSSSPASTHSVPFRYTQQGTATLVAHLDSHNTNHNTTRVQVSHKAPCRWIPIRATTANSSSSTSADAPGGPTPTTRPTAATVALGHYGGGMAGGDSAVIDISVTAGAVLHVTSQGTNRVYKTKQQQQQQQRPVVSATANTAEVEDDEVTRLETTVRCGPDATCWMIPDPTQLQRNARYRQTISYELDVTSHNFIAIDWVSAGRLTRGERWDFTSCQLRTTVSIITTTGNAVDDDTTKGTTAAAEGRSAKTTTTTTKPVFVDAQDLRPGFSGMDYAGNVQFHAFGTVVLYRPDETILARFRQVQRDLCRPHLAVRSSSAGDEDDDDDDVTSGRGDKETSSAFSSRTSTSSFPVASVLSGRVILGLSESETTTDLHICRFTAECNEDLFRIFHYCLGQQVYSERIRAVKSAPPVRVVVPVVVDATAPPPPKTTTTTRSAETTPSAIPHFTPPPLSSSASLLSSLKSPSLGPSLGMLMMADSMFPIGSFAHSFGIEAAAQLGLFPSSDNRSSRSSSSPTLVLHQYLQAVSTSDPAHPYATGLSGAVARHQ